MSTVETTTEDRFYTVPETRTRLGGISHSYFYELVKSGRLRPQKIGSRTVVSQSEITRFVASQPYADIEDG